MSWLLARLGGWLWPAVGLAFVALLAALWAKDVQLDGARAETTTARAEAKSVKAAWDSDVAQANAKALEQATAYRAEEQRRSIQLAKAANEADQKLNRALADAAGAADTARRLRERVAALATASRGTPSDPTTTQAGSAATDAADLLALMFRGLDERADEIARFADRASIAGQACERSYTQLIAD